MSPSHVLLAEAEASPQAVLAWALDRHRGRIALVSSFGAESAALLHMVAALDRATPVIFLETGRLFVETLDYRRELASRLGLSEVRDIRPAVAELATLDAHADLWRRDADACCEVRKVRPLANALHGLDAWITGRKRFQGSLRARLPMLEHDVDGRLKVNPLAGWSKEAIVAYAREHGLPTHPLVARGYASVGCWPCTSPAAEGRAGRWRGSGKTECGIHRPVTPAARTIQRSGAASTAAAEASPG